MAEQCLLVPVSALQTVRLACRNDSCQAVVELPLARVEEVFGNNQDVCPVGLTSLTDDGSRNWLRDLAKAIRCSAAMQKVAVEFLIAAADARPPAGQPA